MTPETPLIPLNDGQTIPQLGLGAFKIEDADAARTMQTALDAGYRAIDTAKIYGNEAGVGRGIGESDLPREAIFLTTKVWNDDQGCDATLRAFDASTARLGLDRVELYLIHWPAPQQGLALDTWKALIRLREDGRARSIGVSNFREPDLREIVEATGVVPAVNQIELHPRFQQRPLRALHAEMGIVTEAWSPLARGDLLADPVLARIAGRHGRTAAQIVLRWHMQLGIVAIPKSGHPARIAENIAVFDFELAPEEMAEIEGLDTPDGRIGPDPDSFPG